MITYFGIGLVVLFIFIAREARETEDNTELVVTILLYGPIFVLFWPLGLLWLFVLDKNEHTNFHNEKAIEIIYDKINEINKETNKREGELKKEALYYHNMGFNISCITNIKNRYNSNSTNTYLKAPNHPWENLNEDRQTFNELNSYPWHLATGLGVITGFNNLVTIDFDNCDYGFVQQTLHDLGLPSNYPWLVLSGSQKGYHIHIFVDGIKDRFAKESVIKLAFKEEYKNLADKVEILIRLHSILPPSVHLSGNQYKFINCSRPKNKPEKIDISSLLTYVEKYFDQAKQKNMRFYKKKFSFKKLFNW